jgi:hypothetical protein
MLLIAVVSGIVSAPMIFSPAVIARPVMAPAIRTQAVAPRPAVMTPLATTQTAAPWVFMMPNIARPIDPAKVHPKPPININDIPQRFAVTPQRMLSCVDGYINPQVLHATICPPLAPVP